MKLADLSKTKHWLLVGIALFLLLAGNNLIGVDVPSPTGGPFPDEDYDQDGLTNAVEAEIGTYPWNPYSDGDLLKDGEDAVPLNGTMKVPAAPETNYAMIDLGEVATVGTPVGVNSSGAVLLNKEDKELRMWSQGTTSLIMSKQSAQNTWPLTSWFVAGPLEDGSVYYAGEFSSNLHTIPWPVDEDFEVNISAQGTNLMKWTPQGSTTVGKVSEFFSYTIPHVESGGSMAGPATPNATSAVMDQTLQTTLNGEYDFARVAFEGYMDILFAERTFSNADSASGAVILGINDAHQHISYGSSSSVIGQPGWFEEQERTLFAGCYAAVCGTGAKSVSYGSADYLYVPGTYYPEPSGFAQIGAVRGVYVNADGFALYTGPHDWESGDDYEDLEIAAGVNSDIPNCGQIVDMNRSTTPEGPYFFGSDESTVPKLWCVGGDYANIELGHSISNLPEPRLVGRRISNRLEIPMKDKLWRNSRVRNVAELCDNPFQWAWLSATQISPDKGLMIATAFKIKNDNGTSLPPQEVKEHGFLLLPAELMVDGNHDGRMSVTDPGIHVKDTVTKDKPFRFWINNDVDKADYVDGTDWEEDDYNTGNPDFQDGEITCRRDLEDFTRLWINAYQIVQVLGGGTGLTVEMEWKPMEGATWSGADGAPSIKLYKATEADGDSKYLTEEQQASYQIANDVNTSIGTVTKGTVYTFPANFFNGLTEENPGKYLLFEGAAAGKGRLIVRFKKGDTVAELPPTYIELKDVKNMYEHWTVGNGEGTAPAASATRATSFQYNNDSPEEKKYILFVHGWNMKPWEKERYAETAFKRLWLQGYKGRFGLFSWPCTNGFEGAGSALGDSTNYDRGEFSAWRSAVPLRAKLADLYGQYNGELSVMAHSMGNAVMSEALRLQSDAHGSQIVKTYVASQAAVPAHIYDSSLADNLQWNYHYPVGDSEVPPPPSGYGPNTPNIYGNWCAFVTSSAAGHSQSVGRIANFYNPNDYALAPDIWEFNQITKPDDRDLPSQPYFYVYNGDPEGPLANGSFRKSLVPYPYLPYSTLNLGSRSAVGDRYEIMAFAAESRTSALGRTQLNPQIMGGINLQDIWPTDPTPSQRNGPYGAHKWHSAQFRSTNMRQKEYWQTLLGSGGFNIQLPPSP